MSVAGPTVGVLEPFKPHLISALTDAVPDGTLIHHQPGDPSPPIDYLITWMVDIDATLLDSVPGLSGVVKLDSGSGKIDTAACEVRGIGVSFTQSPALISVAEHAVMLMLGCFKRLATAMERTRAGRLAPSVVPVLTDQDNYSYNWVSLERFEAIHAKTIGLVGLGRIGKSVARQLSGFDVEVVYSMRHRLSDNEEEGLQVRHVPFDELLRISDCVSLHSRLTMETEKLMGKDEFALMKRGSFFVNTARGRLVDEAALCAALHRGHLAGAALDVFWHEPPLPESPLWNAPNLLMTPHTAGIPIDIALVDEVRHAGEFIAQHWYESGHTNGNRPA